LVELSFSPVRSHQLEDPNLVMTASPSAARAAEDREFLVEQGRRDRERQAIQQAGADRRLATEQAGRQTDHGRSSGLLMWGLLLVVITIVAAGAAFRL
jgi:hypothetical protein